MAAAVALCCLFLFAPRAQASQLSEAQIEAVRVVLVAYEVDLEVLDAVSGILQASQNQAAEEDLSSQEGEVLGATTMAGAPPAILDANGFAGIPGAIEQDAGVEQTEVSEAKSKTVEAVSPAAATAAPAAAASNTAPKTLSLKASAKSLQGKGFTVIPYSFELATTSNFDGISGSISIESNNPTQFSEALISVFATSLDNCPKSGETFASYEKLWEKYTGKKDHILSYILKLAGDTSVSMPVEFTLPTAKVIAPCVFVILDGGFPITSGVLTMKSDMTLKYHGGDEQDNPASIIHIGDEIFFGASYGPLSTLTVGPAVAFRTVTPITKKFKLLALIGDPSAGSFTGSPYPVGPSGNWSIDNDYYVYPNCDLPQGTTGPSDYYNSVPSGAQQLLSVPMSGVGQKALQQPVVKLFSNNIVLNPGDCLVHLVRMIGGAASGVQGAITAENQVRAFVRQIPSISITANPSNIALGASSTIAWSASAVDSCEVFKESSSIAKTLTGKKSTGTLLASTTYKLVCKDIDSSSSVAGKVVPSVNMPQASASTESTIKTLIGYATVSVSAAPDKTKPTIVFTAPANNKKISGSVYISADVSDPAGVKGQSASGIASVNFAINGKIVATKTESPYAYVWHTESIATGTYAIVVTARDKAGNEATATRSVIVSHVPALNTPLARLNRYYYSFPELGDHMDLPLETKPTYIKEPYKKQGSLGYISVVPGPGLKALYACLYNYNSDYDLKEVMSSTKENCEGQQYLALLGYIWSNPGDSDDFAPLYRCFRTNTVTYYYVVDVTFADHYSSRSETCEGGGRLGGRMGYVSKKPAITPRLSFSASPVGVEYGKSAVLTWSAVNASSCRVLLGSTTFAEGVSGTKSTGDLTKNTTYKLSCSSTSGSTVATTTTVAVRPVGDALVTIRAVDPLAAERGGTGQYLIRRVGSTATALAVTVAVSGTATRNADYRLAGGGIVGATGNTITIPASATSTSVTLTPLQDNVVEGTEAVTLTVVRGAGYAPGVPNTQSVSISDDETPIPDTAELRIFTHTSYDGDSNVFIEYAEGLAGAYSGGYWTDSGSLGFIATEQGAGRVELVTCSDVNGFYGYAKYTGTGSCQPLYENVGSLGYGWSAANTDRHALYQCVRHLSASPNCGEDYLNPSFYVQNVKVVHVPTIVSVAATVTVASEAGATGAFAVTRAGTDLNALTVTLGVAGTATRNGDYKLAGGGLTSTGNTVTIPKNATQVMLTVTPINDIAVEGSETILLSIVPSSSSAAKYSASTNASGATVSIADNDKAATTTPTVTLTASPVSVGSGQSATLSWKATNTTSCTGAGFTAGGTSGSATVKPVKTTTYSVSCTATGSTAKITDSATVTVTAAPPPTLKNCTFNGKAVASGSSVTAYKTETVPSGSVCANQKRVCTNGVLSGTYPAASCKVLPLLPPPPTVTLTASPTSVSSGRASTLTWKATNATSCTGTGFTAGGTSGSVSVKPAKTTKYSISCSAPHSTAKATASVTVTVGALGAPATSRGPSATALLASVAMAPFSIATDALTDIFVMFGIGQSAAVVTSRSSATVNASPMLLFSIDPKSPTYSLAAGGSTGVVLGRYKVHASGDSISLLRLELKLDSGAPSDLTQVYLYNGAVLVGTAVFTNSTTATVALTVPMKVPANGDVVLQLQSDISPIGISKPGKAGSLVVVNTANYTAISSGGTTISGSAASSNGSVAGVRIYRSFPRITVSARTPCVGPSACRGANVTLGRFEIAANPAGDIGVRTISASVVAESAEVDNAKLYAYSDPNYASPVGGVAGQVGSSCDRPDKVSCAFIASPALEIPAGMTYYFMLRGDVIPRSITGAWSASTVLLGDASLRMLSTPNVADYFSWSPNDITASGVNDPDWTNGFMLPNLQVTPTTPVSITVTAPKKGSVFATTTIPFSWSWKGIKTASAVPVMRLLDADGNEKYGMLGKEGGLSFTDAGGSGILPPPANLIIPTGKAAYKVQICSALSNGLCVVSAPFYIVKGAATGPSISGIDAPTALKVEQTGTWKVNVTNPGSKLSYSVVWGDESTNINSKAQSPSQTSATFTHTYAKAGTYNPLFTVKNSNGYSQAGAQVVVSGNAALALRVEVVPQSANSLAPEGAIVPFTNISIKNTGSKEAIMKGINVQLRGAVSEKAFHGMRIEMDGYMGPWTVGRADASFGSDGSMTIPIDHGMSVGAGATFTVSAEMAEDLSAFAGQTAAFEVVGIVTTALVEGTLPLSGSTHTLNATLSACPGGEKKYGYRCWVDVKPVSAITVTVPNGGEKWELGMTNTITWTPYSYNPDANPAKDVTAYLEKKDGSTYQTVGQIMPEGKASIHWSGEIGTYGTYAKPGTYYVRVVNNVTGATDRSDAAFTIIEKKTDLKLNGSDGPLTLSQGQRVTAAWKSVDTNGCALFNASDIATTTKTEWFMINNLPSSGSRKIYVPNLNPPYGAIVRVDCQNKNNGVWISDSVAVTMTQAGPAAVVVTSPNGGETLATDKTTRITWSNSNVSQVSVGLYKNDKWYAWITKDAPVSEGKNFTELNPNSLKVPADLMAAGNVFKIYVTGKKSDGTGYVDDKSDSTFEFSSKGNISDAPTLSLSATPASIISGKSSTLKWSSANATSCVSTGSEIASDIRLSGAIAVSPVKNAVYTIVCKGAGGSVTKSATVTVSAPPPPKGCTFNNKAVASGKSVTAYKASSVAFGGKCASQQRTCTNGTLSGSYAYPSCVVKKSAIPMPDETISGSASAAGSLLATAVMAPLDIVVDSLADIFILLGVVR